MALIDTHAHLYLPDFEDDIEQVITRAQTSGVERILLPNIDQTSLDPLKLLCAHPSGIFLPMIGLHPTSVKEDYHKEIEIVKQELQTNHYIAIGEIGIDLYWDKSHYQLQVKAFEQQIQLALQYDLPIVVHARDSFKEILNVLEKFKNTGLRGVLHSFTGNISQAERALDLGFYLGVGGIATFKNAGVGEIINHQPLENLILETDSPYLAPTPLRGKRNESSYLIHVARKLAELKKMEVSQIENVTTANAKKLFRI